MTTFFHLQVGHTLPGKYLHQSLTSTFQVICNFLIQRLRKQVARSRVKVKYCRNLTTYDKFTITRIHSNLHQFLIFFSIFSRKDRHTHTWTHASQSPLHHYSWSTGDKISSSLNTWEFHSHISHQKTNQRYQQFVHHNRLIALGHTC